MKSIVQHILESGRVYEFDYAGRINGSMFKYGELANTLVKSHFTDDNEKLTTGYNASTGEYYIFPLVSSTAKDFEFTWKTDTDEEIHEFITKVKIITAKEAISSGKEYQYFY